MIELKGKYANAYVYTDNIDEETTSQIIQILNSPVTKNANVRIMPDCHAGAGCVIGTTMHIIDKVIPNVVGVDIGCGMRVRCLGQVDIDYEKVDKFIHDNIPSGFDCREDIIKGYKVPELNHLKCFKYLKDIDRLYKGIGTLGGGNHFIEIDKDDDNNMYLVIHSGSRNLGLQVAKYYQQKAVDNVINLNGNPQEIINQLKEEGRIQDIEKVLKEFFEKRKLEIGSMNKDVAFVSDALLDNYLHDMKICQEYAQLSRKVMEEQISCFILNVTKIMLNKKYETFETIHNYIDIENMILRKGAVSAKLNEKLLIPINMAFGSLICIGKGNDEWNQSAPHGAGRILSRASAKKSILLEDYRESMSGIYTTSVSDKTIDESPFAYKPAEEIINNICDTVDIIKIIKPTYNFKAEE